jgi:hypothetical protein
MLAMEPKMFSPFLYQFVLNSVVFSSLILVVALILATFFRKSAATVFACSFGGLVFAFLVPVLFLLGNRINQHHVEIPIDAILQLPQPVFGSVGSGAPNTVQARDKSFVRGETNNKRAISEHSLGQSGQSVSSAGIHLQNLVDLAILVYPIVSVFLFLRLFGALVGIRRMFNQSRLITSDSNPELSSLIAQLSQHRVTLRTFSGLKSPVAMQFPNRAILVPDEFFSTIPFATIGRVVEHERAHIFRNDHLTLLIQEIIVCIYWFNPLVHTAKRIVNCAREDVCDNWVLAKHESTEYCRDLVTLSEAKAGGERLVPGLIRSRDIGRRIQSLLNKSRITQVAVSRKMSTMIGVLFSASGLLAFFFGIGFTQDNVVRQGANGRVEQDPAQLSSEELTNLVFSFTNPQQIRAIVTDGETGAPVIDADVRLYDVNQLETKQELLATSSTSITGEFEFRDLTKYKNPDLHLVILISHKDYASQIHPLRNSMRYLQNKDNWRISLEKRASLTGRITDVQGKPIEGVEVWQPMFLSEPVPGFLHDKTGSDGRFAINDHAKFDTIETRRRIDNNTFSQQRGTGMMYRHPEFGRKQFMVEKIPGNIELKLDKAISVKGRVIEKGSGKPIPGLIVRASGHDSSSFENAKTDSNGNYEFSLVSTTKFNLKVYHPELDAKARVVSGKSGQAITVDDLELESLVTVKGIVIDDETEKPFTSDSEEPFVIHWYDEACPKTTAECKSAPINKDGTFELKVLPGEIFPYIGNHSLIEVGGKYKEGLLVSRDEPIELEFRVRKRDD